MLSSSAVRRSTSPLRHPRLPLKVLTLCVQRTDLFVCPSVCLSALGFSPSNKWIWTRVVMTWRMWANISHVGGMWVLDGFLLPIMGGVCFHCGRKYTNAPIYETHLGQIWAEIFGIGLWTLRLRDTSPTRQFTYCTLRLRSPQAYIFHYSYGCRINSDHTVLVVHCTLCLKKNTPDILAVTWRNIFWFQ